MKSIIIMFIVFSASFCKAEIAIHRTNTAEINQDTILYDSDAFDMDYNVAFSKEVYEQWAKQGDICKEYGHRWEDTTPHVVYATNPPTLPPNERTCSVCGKRQVEKAVAPEWVDIE